MFLLKFPRNSSYSGVITLTRSDFFGEQSLKFTDFNMVFSGIFAREGGIILDLSVLRIKLVV